MNKQMMTLGLALIIAILSSETSYAGGREAGNGGNAVICKDPHGSVSSVELLDYYELRLKGGVSNLNPSLGNYTNMLLDIFSRWEKVAPKRMDQYRKWLTEFSSSAGMYSGVTIPAIPDTGTILIPNGCELKPIAFQRPDEEVLLGVKRYTIDKDIWDLLPELQKAGLVIHELIYREGIKAAHETSFPTRYFNGYLVSATPDAKEYAVVVNRLPLAWVEIGEGLVLKLGQLTVPSQGGQPYFKHTGNVSDEGRSFKGEILEVFGRVQTPDLSIQYSDPKSCIGRQAEIQFDFNGAFTLGGCPITEISIRDWAYLKFVNPFDGGLGKIADAATSVNITPNAHEVNIDPSVSWLKNGDGTKIHQITKVDTNYNLYTTSGTKWSFRVNGMWVSF